MADKKLKIAQVAPTWVKVPPEKYGGAELIISHLADSLTDRGHDVTLFASGDSKTKASLDSCINIAGGIGDNALTDFNKRMRYYYTTISPLIQKQKFDLIHWHISYDLLPYFVAQIPSEVPSVVTFHNYYEGIYGHINDLLESKPRSYNVAISKSLTKQFPFEFAKIIYNGIDIDKVDFVEKPKEYMAWVGRFKELKGPDIAIKAADKLQKDLCLMAEPRENDFYNKVIVPLLDQSKFAKYEGAVSQNRRNKIVGNAKLFINPIRWEEPFGLVVPEANACGTPVIAYERGAMSEIIEDGKNGLLVKPDDFEGLLRAAEKIYQMSDQDYLQMRRDCRQLVGQKFTTKKMVDEYEKLYQKIIADKKQIS